MGKCKGFAAGAAACLAAASPAAAGVVKTSFGVSATVVATCRILPGQANPCAPVMGQAPAIRVETPVVTYTHDARTGAVIQMIEF